MKHLPIIALIATALSLGIAEAQLVDTTYSANQTLSASYFLEGNTGGTTATWIINPGVTVTGGRYFIGSTATPNAGLATFVVAGGGILDITRVGVFNLRLGQNGAPGGVPASEAGALIIRGGSTVKLSGTTAGAMQEQAASSITLDGVGSTFSSVGTWNAGTGRFLSQSSGTGGVLNSGAIPVTAVGGVINASVSGTFTTLSVLAAPPDPVLNVSSPTTIQSDGLPVNVSIPFTNSGATLPLSITSVTPGGADAAFVTVNSFTSPVAPGGSGTIELTFTPITGGGGGGPYSADLTIASNDSANPSQVIVLSAAVSDPAMSIVQSSVDFGTLAANPGPVTASVSVTNDGATSDLIVSATLLGNTPEYQITSIPGPIPPGGSANIVLTLTSGALAGHFGSLLSITSDAAYNSSAIIPVIAQVTPATTAPTSLTLVNGDFNANAYNSQNPTAPNGWTSSLVGVAGNYGQTIVNISAGYPALFWARGGNYLQQDLTTSNSGLTANKLTGVQVSFDRGYRNDVVTRGDILVRLSLWDLTTDTEISGRDVVIEDTGVIAGTGSNQLTSTGITLPVSTAAANPVALRIATVQPFLLANQFEATALIDNVSVAVSGTYNPSTPFQAWALANSLDGTPGKENGVDDDPDQDGATNFEEFAFGANPLSSSSTSLAGVVTADTTSDTQNELLITVAVRNGASFGSTPSPSATVDGVTYSIQGSIALTAFDQVVEGPIASSVIPANLPAIAPSGYEYLTFRLAGSNGLPSRGFLRAVASEAP